MKRHLLTHVSRLACLNPYFIGSETVSFADKAMTRAEKMQGLNPYFIGSETVSSIVDGSAPKIEAVLILILLEVRL